MENNSAKKVLILGAGGMLGHDLALAFKDYQLTLWDQPELDITDAEEVNAKIGSLMPDIVINAAAYTDVAGAENDQKTAMRVNADAVGYVAKVCDKIGAIVVHFSTESVFDGRNPDGYNENDLPSPVNAYGRSKAEGEQRLIENCQMYYLIRTSSLYGQAPQKGKPRGVNFVQMMLQLARDGKEIKVVNDQFVRPTYTTDLAAATRQLLESGNDCGIYHLTNSESCNWFEFAQKIFELTGISADLQPTTTAEYQSQIPRPKYAILNNTKLAPLRSWQEALKEYLQAR